MGQIDQNNCGTLIKVNTHKDTHLNLFSAKVKNDLKLHLRDIATDLKQPNLS